ncbi:MAG: Si-specific NAD(P)(+) transhydrogenase [Phycisphaeraceae bacterium]|nr:Si-specific NAD(P)(+) transhydrogenase [Phycisphaeraceae bacterium]MCW5763347.1 Si-specific NAD(P)(+) transhydrogenase [Phycisphaeraceae bacterium]
MRYDLCVIGSGPAGQKGAIQASKLGKSVCVIEKREVVGGVTVNTGTIPSKALREAILHMIGHASATPLERDFAAARNRSFTELIASCRKVILTEVEMIERHFRSNGINLFHGSARFVEPHVIEAVSESGIARIEADHFIIAVGSHPAKPDDIEFDGANIITSDELLSLPFLPHSLLVVGGGVIGTEYASMLAALGVKVTLVEGRNRLLDFVDAEISEALQYHLRRSGMTLRLGEKVVSIGTVAPQSGARSVNNRLVEAVLESDKVLRADCLLYCVGRQGATDGLDLEKIGLSSDSRGRLAVNEHLQTAVPHIYACGDVIGFPALASTSMEQGRIAACHMFHTACTNVPEQIPYGVYAIPEISMVGWTEERLTAEGIPYESGIAQYSEIARGQLLGDLTGMLKMLIHQETHQILGVHAIGTGATELIHIGQAAIAFNATVEYFVNAVFNYPTLAECYKVAALNGLNKLRGV